VHASEDHAQLPLAGVDARTWWYSASAVLGGAYSSTLTTVVLAKRAREQSRLHLYSGAMLVASGVMYLRLFALLGIFKLMPVALAGGAIVIAAASNNLIKGVYACSFGDSRTGTQGLALLMVLALLGLLPLFTSS